MTLGIVTWFLELVRSLLIEKCSVLGVCDKPSRFYSFTYFVHTTAYREGVVIAICKGCNAKHMIADNLGSGCMDGTSNIEEYFKTKGMEDIVNRVSSEVFELEKMLDFDGLLGEDGNPVLE